MAFNITSVVRSAGQAVSSRPMCMCSVMDKDHETASSAFIPFGHALDVGPHLLARNDGFPTRHPHLPTSPPPSFLAGRVGPTSDSCPNGMNALLAAS